MRIVLMGTGPFAVPSFDAIAKSSDEIVAVITKSPVLGSKKPIINPVEQWALSANLPLYFPATIRDSATISMLQDMQADLAVVCDYGQILNQAALSSFRLGAINLHGSLLPRHRGAAPVQWSLLTGDSTVGVSIICMTVGLDAGPILTTAATQVLPHENAAELEPRLSELGVQSTLDAIDRLRACDSIDDAMRSGIAQIDAESSRAPRLKKSDGHLNFSWKTNLLDRVIRAMQPWPGAFADLEIDPSKTIRVLIHRARVSEITAQSPPGLEPGTLVIDPQWIGKANLGVVTGDGVLVIDSLQPAGKRAMSAKDFAAGYARQKQVRFVLPPNTTLVS